MNTLSWNTFFFNSDEGDGLVTDLKIPTGELKINTS